MEFVKRKIMDATEAEEIEPCPDRSMEMVNPKVCLEKLDVDITVCHGERGEPVIVPLVLSEYYCINFADYRDGIGGYLKTEFVDDDMITR